MPWVTLLDENGIRHDVFKWADSSLSVFWRCGQPRLDPFARFAREEAARGPLTCLECLASDSWHIGKLERP